MNLTDIQTSSYKPIAFNRQAIQLQHELAVLVYEAELALKKAEDFSRDYKLHFRFSPAHGMGGVFCEVQNDDEDDIMTGEFAWYPSSQDC